jgi:acyl carrier protein
MHFVGRQGRLPLREPRNRPHARLTITPAMSSTTAPASTMSDPLVARLKTLIVESLKLDDVRPEDIPDNEPLFGSEKFGLDSIDALELVLKLEKEFGVKIGSSEESRRALASVNELAAFIRARQAGAKA